MKGPRKLYRYSAEFKRKAVRLSQNEGVRVQDVADAREIHPFMLSKWRRDAREGRLRACIELPLAVQEQREVQSIGAGSRLAAKWSSTCTIADARQCRSACLDSSRDTSGDSRRRSSFPRGNHAFTLPRSRGR